MTLMDRLPTVISCCCCCYVRAGTVMIGIVSFLVGLLLAPNIAHTKGFWYIDPESGVLSYYGTAAENGIRVALGIVSVMLCAVSIMLVVGALCNTPKLIAVYQWGSVLYCLTTCLIYFVLAMLCFLVHDSVVSGFVLLGLVAVTVVLTIYFLIVTNSLRVTQRLTRASNYSTGP